MRLSENREKIIKRDLSHKTEERSFSSKSIKLVDSDKFAVLNRVRGFTLVEMLVVMALIAFLSTTLILYSRTGERQIILFKDQASIIAALSRAKSLSISTFSQTGASCGYGVHFEAPRKFLIFKDLAADCNASDNIYSGGNELFESFELNQSLHFGNLTLTDVVFIPPNPRVVITPTQDEAIINITTADGGSSLNVKVTSAGQISTQ